MMFDLFKKKVSRASKTSNQTDTQCNHNPNSPSSSLKKVSKRTMVTPDKYGFVCPFCGEAFVFKKDANGHFSEV